MDVTMAAGINRSVASKYFAGTLSGVKSNRASSAIKKARAMPATSAIHKIVLRTVYQLNEEFISTSSLQYCFLLHKKDNFKKDIRYSSRSKQYLSQKLLNSTIFSCKHSV
jgi:hypothetical protein